MKEKILKYLKEEGEQKPFKIAEELNISRQMTHKYLKSLITEGKILKSGTPPSVYYAIKPAQQVSQIKLTKKESEFLNQNFIEVTPSGELLEGPEAFIYWCQKRQLPLKKTLIEYQQTVQKYQQYKQNNVISGLKKLQSTKGFTQICLEDVFYLDFYAIERFGKTKLGKLIHYGKQSQNIELLHTIVQSTKEAVKQLLGYLNIQAIAYNPPTIKRDIQIMKVLEKGYAFKLPLIKLEKVTGNIIVPQKALSKIEDRIENSQRSIMVDENRAFENILLIDDAVGSGATLNETACKLLHKKTAQKVYGLAITGSFKGFEVITEA